MQTSGAGLRVQEADVVEQQRCEEETQGRYQDDHKAEEAFGEVDDTHNPDIDAFTAGPVALIANIRDVLRSS